MANHNEITLERNEFHQVQGISEISIEVKK